MRPIHIAICIPSSDIVMTDFCLSLARLVNETRITLSFVNTRSSMIIDNRNKAVAAVLEANSAGARITHILFLDTDMTFPGDTLERLLAHDVEFVLASYVRRVPPHKLINYPLPHISAALDRSGKRELIEIAAGPLGCALIDVNVFNRVLLPHFGYEHIAGDELIDRCDDFVLYKDILPPPPEINPRTMYSISEDVWFCARVRHEGIPIYMDVGLTAELGHVGYKVFTTNDIPVE